MSASRFDIVIIGGGIVGLATAYQLLKRYPSCSLCLIEKEQQLAQHQSGHNSGVLHSGIYYRPGSLRAANCTAGKRAMEEFCQAEGIPFNTCGKVIVATERNEIPRLAELYDRGQANGIPCEIVDGDALRSIEPAVAGLQAIHVPGTGIVDYGAVCLRLAERVRQMHGEILLGTAAKEIKRQSDGVYVATSATTLFASQLINCAGLYSDRIAKLAGDAPEIQIVPFRGEYYTLSKAASRLVNGLIYPVPDPRFPFLGVHLTRMIHGGVECGPNAVLAGSREGYSKLAMNPHDLMQTMAYSGFRKLAAKYWRMGMFEMWRSVSKRAFVAAVQRLVPAITEADLVPAPAGVRAQALNRDGTLVDDFIIQKSNRMIHVLNAPSPAATSSLTIGSQIVDQLDPLVMARDLGDM